VRRAWQDRGFFEVQVRDGAKLLTSNPASERISVAVQVDEGQQFLLGSITFKNNRGRCLSARVWALSAASA
jgi:outer membrane protein assembly factor BamA